VHFSVFTAVYKFAILLYMSNTRRDFCVLSPIFLKLCDYAKHKYKYCLKKNQICYIVFTYPQSSDMLNHVSFTYNDKKLSCRREIARCFVSLNISLSHSHSRSLKVIRN